MNSTQNNPLDEEDDEINDLSTSVVNRIVAFCMQKKNEQRTSAAYFIFSLSLEICC